MWQENRVATDDVRKGLPYAPYLMFVIERVTGYQLVKAGLHKQYKIEKARHDKASETIASPSDVPESSAMERRTRCYNGSRPFLANAPRQLRGNMRHRWSSGRCVQPQISHLFLLHHHLHTMTCLIF
jgi:hypothetical protein